MTAIDFSGITTAAGVGALAEGGATGVDRCEKM
jgi:hypothetical protein